MIPFWIFMTALAFPLVLIATAAIGSSIYAATVEQQENNDPIVFSSNTVWLGPFSVATNVRGWAGLCVVLGIVLTAIGLKRAFVGTRRSRYDPITCRSHYVSTQSLPKIADGR